MDYLFISYSSKNQDIACKIKDILAEKGYIAWLAPNDIPYGEKYATIITKAIKDCKCFLLLMSQDVLKSNWVNREVERAINNGKKLFVLKLDDCTLNSEFEFYLSIVQASSKINALSKDDEVICKLCDEIDKVYNDISNNGHPIEAIIKPTPIIDTSNKAQLINHAKELLNAFLDSPQAIIEILKSLNFANINDYLFEIYDTFSQNQKETICNNLLSSYQMALLDSDLTGRKEYSAKGQIVFYLTRLECINKEIVIEKLKNYYDRESNIWQRQSIAYGLASLGEYTIPYDYALKIYLQKDEDIVNRSWTLIFYGDVQNEDPYSYIDDGTSKWDNCKQARINRLRRVSPNVGPKRSLDLAVLFAFYRSRNWKDINEIDYETIKNCSVDFPDMPKDISKFIKTLKKELVSNLKTNLNSNKK